MASHSESKDRLEWSGALGVATGAVLLILVFFGYHLFGKVLVSTDISIAHIQFFAVRYDGSAPLWNPHAGLGLSLVDDLQFAAYYPPRWPFFVFPWMAWVNPYYVVHYFIAFVGMYGLLRSVGLGRGASFGGGAAYLCGGFMMATVIAMTIYAAASWLPILLWGALTPKRYGAPLSAIALTMIIWIGGPHLMIYGTMGFALSLLSRVVAERGRPAGEHLGDLGRRGAYFALGIAAGIGNLVPGLMQVTRSVRAGADPLTNLDKSLEWRELGSIFFGGSGGIIYPEFNDKAMYIGGVGLTLAMLGLVDREKSRGAARRAGLWLTLTGITFALGKTIGWQHVLGYLPGLKLLAGPGRALVLAAAGMAILIGLGLEAATGTEGRRRWLAGGLAITLAGAALVLPMREFELEMVLTNLRRWLSDPSAVVGLSYTMFDLPLTLTLALAGLALSAFFPRWGRAVLLSLLLIQLLHFSPRVRARAETPDYIDPPDPVASLMMKPDLPPFRVSGIDPLQAHDMEWDSLHMFTFLAPNSSTLFGLEEIGMYNPLLGARYREFIRQSSGQAPFNDPMRNLDPAKADPELFRELNVKYLIGHPMDRRVTHLPVAVSPSAPVTAIPDWEGLGLERIDSWQFVSFLYGPAELALGDIVAELIVQSNGGTMRFPVRYGEQTARLNETDEVLSSFDLPVHMSWHRYPGHASEPAKVREQSYRGRIDFGRSIEVDGIYWRLLRDDLVFQISSQAARITDVGDQRSRWLLRRDDPVAPIYEFLDTEERVSLFSEFDILDDEHVTASQESQQTARINWIEHLNTRVIFEVESESGGLLVLRDGWHPAWQATIDGQAARVLRVNELFRGIRVPGGEHRIQFRFVPVIFFLLIAPSTLAAMALIAMLIRELRVDSRGRR